MRAAPRLFLALFCVTFGLGGAKLSSMAPSADTLRTATPEAQQQQLIVFNAGSLTASFGDLLNEFTRLHPEVTPQQESSGSLGSLLKKSIATQKGIGSTL